jgi:hypothetical protein
VSDAWTARAAVTGALVVSDLSKTFDGNPALVGVDLEVDGVLQAHQQLDDAGGVQRQVLEQPRVLAQLGNLPIQHLGQTAAQLDENLGTVHHNPLPSGL